MFDWLTDRTKEIPPSSEYMKGLEKQIEELRGERRTLKDEVDDLKAKRKVEDEQLKHLLKIKEEKMELEFQKKAQDLEARKQNEVAEVKDKYRDKMETELRTRGTELKEMYGQILARLPDVNMAITGKVGKR